MSLAYFPKPKLLQEIRPQGHVVIEASAGTGKTYTIEHLVVDLLLTACFGSSATTQRAWVYWSG